MDSVSESESFDFGGANSDVEDLEMGFPADDGVREYRPSPARLPPGPREEVEMAPPAAPQFGLEFHVPELPRRTKTVLAIAAGGAAGGFLVGGPFGATAGAVLGYLMA